jgi:precorrin-6Y C5,15-methyltransferase (decarboxylating)
VSQPVSIVGLEADGVASLSPRARKAIEAATFLAGGRRHLELIGQNGRETFTITNNLQELADRLRRRTAEERCVVLASGDPLFFGIGHFLSESLGREQIIVEPAISSMQRAFAKAGIAWHNAEIVSIHGRPLEKTLLPLLGHPTIGVFTQNGDSPAEIAGFFLDRDLDDYDVWVAENLGTGFESVTTCTIHELVDRRFGDLNVVILKRSAETPPPRPEPAGIPDCRFAQPDSGPILLTHADIRALTLARFRDLPDGPIWDIGAGLGGVSVELARAFPEREIVAIERSEDQLSYLRANRLRLSAFNLRIVVGEAPECLSEEPAPAAVFLGGSGGRLDAILDVCFARIGSGGVLTANFVSLENVTRCLERCRAAGWNPELAQAQVNRAESLGGLTVFAPQRPVWILRAARPTTS